jgi:hypothetical protein
MGERVMGFHDLLREGLSTQLMLLTCSSVSVAISETAGAGRLQNEVPLHDNISWGLVYV